jgi:hypothetical protein
VPHQSSVLPCFLNRITRRWNHASGLKGEAFQWRLQLIGPWFEPLYLLRPCESFQFTERTVRHYCERFEGVKKRCTRWIAHTRRSKYVTSYKTYEAFENLHVRTQETECRVKCEWVGKEKLPLTHKNLVFIYLTTFYNFLSYTASNGRVTCEWRIGNDMWEEVVAY